MSVDVAKAYKWSRGKTPLRLPPHAGYLTPNHPVCRLVTMTILLYLPPAWILRKITNFRTNFAYVYRNFP
jgi:hypothetical protein